MKESYDKLQSREDMHAFDLKKDFLSDEDIPYITNIIEDENGITIKLDYKKNGREMVTTSFITVSKSITLVKHGKSNDGGGLSIYDSVQIDSPFGSGLNNLFNVIRESK
ncbi:MAG: hypothetical protein ACTSP4_00600 [Candidatus Hodarchaeales archaeon]